MVKNKKGGSRHKKMARKNVSSNYDNIKLVTSSNEFEQYARVTKLLGNGMAEVLCNDGKRRLLIIRGKFCGRNRRDNQINIDSLVLVGVREWEVVNKKKLPKVDLLYVYLKTQTDELKKIKNFNKKILPLELQEAVEAEAAVEAEEAVEAEAAVEAEEAVEAEAAAEEAVEAETAVEAEEAVEAQAAEVEAEAEKNRFNIIFDF